MSAIIDLKSKRGIVLLCYCLLILLTVAFIFNNSLFSKDESGAQSGALARLLKPIFDPLDKLPFEEFEHIIRKAAHFSEFGLLGLECALLAFHISRGFKIRDAVYSAFATLLVADLDELLQLFTERGSRVSDVFIDFSGAVCGIAAGYAAAITVRAIYRRLGNNKNKPTDRTAA